MSAVLIDSNVLLDLLTKDAVWSGRSAAALAEAADVSRLVINPIIYAEISVHYSEIEALDAALPTAMIGREDLPYDAAFLAGKAFLTYRRRGGTRHLPLPGLSHRRACRRRRVSADDARCGALSDLLSGGAVDRSLNRTRIGPLVEA